MSVETGYGLETIGIIQLRRLGGKLGVANAWKRPKAELVAEITEIADSRDSILTRTTSSGEIMVAGVLVV